MVKRNPFNLSHVSPCSQMFWTATALTELPFRGIYAGAVGYFSADGSMDTCIVLRTAVVKKGTMHVQAGAGIVADSDWENEYAECEAKAKAVVRAAEEAINLAS